MSRKKVLNGKTTEHPVRRNPFADLKPEVGQPERQLQVRENVTIARWINLFKSLVPIEVNIDEVYSPIMSCGMDIDEKRTYQSFLAQIEGTGIVPSSNDIERFSVMVPGLDQNRTYFEKKVGLFLSALIETSKDNEFVLHIQDEIPSHLCFRNRKNVTIYGDLWDVGIEMIAGRITVNGNLKHAGSFSTDGEIHINGKLESRDFVYVRGGKIYVNKELVFDGDSK